jgi:UbiD family decarboxylase
MTHRTMRDFLSALEKKGMLRRIKKPVDRMWEPAALAKWMYQAMPPEQRFGMYFENVEGSDIPLVTGALGANRTTYATALDIEPDNINAAWMNACRNPIKPKVVEQGLCQEVVLTGKDIKLSYLPIPVWTPGKDAGQYITTNVVTKDCDTGIQNVGVYRTMVRDETSVAVNLHIHRHGFEHMYTWLDKGKVMPIAWVIAAPPALQLASVILMPNGVDEATLAGGMMGEPVEMVKAKTIDLLVPANAEIIIEGEIHVGETCSEGPFGEFAGYMGEVVQRPIARITAITHRKNPVYYGFTSQMPPSESTTIQSLANAGVLQKKLVDDMGEKTVSDVFIDLFFAGVLGHAIIAMKPLYPGHAKKVGRLVAAMSPVKRVTIVDDDVDIRDPHHIDWALNSRFNPVRDTILISDVFFPLDPSIRDAHTDNVMGSKMICDCTAKTDPGTFSLPPKAVMDRALQVWKDIDLPPFEIPKRAKLRFDVS